MNAYAIAQSIHGATCVINRYDGSAVATWDQLSTDETLLAMAAVEHLMRLPEALTAVELHDLWADLKIDDGWEFGVEFCSKTKKHPSLIPFDRLCKTEQLKDEIWAALIEVYRPHYTPD